jgi:glycosyltransferase involved in cell wall biosynthesis
MERGHTVDLIAGSGSQRYGGSLTVHRAPSKQPVSRIYRKLLFQGMSWRAARKADVVISNGRIDYLWAIAKGGTPIIHVFHHPTQQSEVDCLLRMRSTGVRFIGVSHDQVAGLEPSDRIDAVYNCVDVRRMTATECPESPPYVAFLGRLTANKGVHLAIQAAQIAGVKLVIAGNVSDSEPGAREYFQEQIVPHLGPEIEYIGVVNDVEKTKLLSGASAMLFPIQWREPFGNVMAESLACGCPVIGWRNGSVPEVIRHGATGFIVDSLEEMVTAIRAVSAIDRKACRREAESRFDKDVLVEGYLHVIHKLLGKQQVT